MANVRRAGEELLAYIEGKVTESPEDKPGLWAVDLGKGEPVPLISLSPGQLDRIQVRHEVSWLTMIQLPLTRLAVAELLVIECARSRGIKKYEPPAEAADLFGLFVKIESDLPAMPDASGDGEPDPTPAS